MNVLVAGGTGFVGTALCEELAGRGNDVTALARDPGEADFDADVTVARGDVTDRDSLDDPVEGQDALVNLVALSPLFQPSGGDEAQFRVHLGGTENCVDAAAAAGVDRFLQQSSLGAAPDALTAHLRAKAEAEAVVRESDLEWTITRPSVIFGEGGEFVSFTKLLSPPYVTPMPGGGRNPFQPIWRQDIVPMLADAVEGTVTGPRARTAAGTAGTDGGTGAPDADVESGNGEDATSGDAVAASVTSEDAPGGSGADSENPHAFQVYELGGPEVLTMAEVAELAWAADGRPVNVLPIPMPLVGAGLKLLGYVPGAPFGADQYRGLQVENTTSNNAVGAFGYDESDLRTLADYLGVDEAAAPDGR